MIPVIRVTSAASLYEFDLALGTPLENQEIYIITVRLLFPSIYWVVFLAKSVNVGHLYAGQGNPMPWCKSGAQPDKMSADWQVLHQNRVSAVGQTTGFYAYF